MPKTNIRVSKRFRIPSYAVLVAGNPDCVHYSIIKVEGMEDVGVCQKCGRTVNYTQAQKGLNPVYLGKSLKAKW